MRTQRSDGTTVNAGDEITHLSDGARWVYDEIASFPDPHYNPAFAGRIQASRGESTQLFYPPEFGLSIADA